MRYLAAMLLIGLSLPLTAQDLDVMALRRVAARMERALDELAEARKTRSWLRRQAEDMKAKAEEARVASGAAFDADEVGTVEQLVDEERRYEGACVDYETAAEGLNETVRTLEERFRAARDEHERLRVVVDLKAAQRISTRADARRRTAPRTIVLAAAAAVIIGLGLVLAFADRESDVSIVEPLVQLAPDPGPATSPWTSPMRPAEEGKWTDLLERVDPEADAVVGLWTLQDGALVSDHTGGARLSLPYMPPEEYDFRIEFTTTATKACMAQLVSHGDVPFTWSMAAGTPPMCRVEDVDGHSVLGNPTLRRYTFTPGRRHTATVVVRNNSVAGMVDGQVLVAHRTDYGDLSRNEKWTMPDQLRLGLGTCYGPVTFHKAEVRVVSGKGSFVPSGFEDGKGPPVPSGPKDDADGRGRRDAVRGPRERVRR